MKDPYKDAFDSIVKAINTNIKMIAWIAERTLSVKDYKEFADEFSQKTNDKDKLINDLMHKDRSDKDE